MMEDSYFMNSAFQEAHHAMADDEVPVGCIIVAYEGKYIVGRGHNCVRNTHDPTLHAEIVAIRQACNNLHTEYLSSCDLYTTLEPCAMCAGAIFLTRIRRLYFAAYDIKMGVVDHSICLFSCKSYQSKIRIYGGLQERRSKDMLKSFFCKKR